MEQKKQLGVYREGCIYANDDNKSVEHDEFWDKFIEANGWPFWRRYKADRCRGE